MKQVKWGIIGLGGIASKFADGFQFTKNARLLAISSKNENKLLEFKNKFQIDENYCYSNYDSLLECKDLDMVYIALPHSFHHEWVIKSIEKGKNILVEKPATINFSQMENIKNNLKNKNIDGMLGCFTSDDENLSFVELNDKGLVKQVREKEKISSLASTGLYVFSNVRQFVEAAETMIKNDRRVKDEFFVSEIYNILLKSGKKFEIDIAEEFIPFGTPEDIKKFETK